MDAIFNGSSLYGGSGDPFDERPNSSGNSGDSPPSTALASAAISSHKRRRGIQKKVVTVPIADVEGSRLNKGDCITAPSDSWAWRKYGQKPIKGSPYPRGYYRCSSSKGCPARKQVERSRLDPTTLVVTYSYDHNHSLPVSRNHHSAAQPATRSTAAVSEIIPEVPPRRRLKIEESDDQKAMADLGGDVESLITADDFDWSFPGMETTSSTILDDPIFAAGGDADDLARCFPMMGEEEASLFADLEELPECSVVFGGKAEEERRRICGIPAAASAPWCGTTG